MHGFSIVNLLLQKVTQNGVLLQELLFQGGADLAQGR
jgi:hypothetical protein